MPEYNTLKRITFILVFALVFSVLNISGSSSIFSAYGNSPKLSKEVRNGQKKAKQIEDKILAIKDKLIKSTVRCSSGGSGVIISEDGYVLTAGHVFREPGDIIRIRTYDGTRYNALTLGKDVRADYGLLKIIDEGKWEYAELGHSSKMAKDETCLMLGFPGTNDYERPAVIRIGFFYGQSYRGFLQTSCIMMPGDSGGPLFDLNGKVIGINSRIDEDLKENYFAPVDKVRENWEKLVDSEVFNRRYRGGWGHYNWDEIRFKEAPKLKKAYVLNGSKSGLNEILSSNAYDFRNVVVKINSYKGLEKTEVHGTIIHKDGLIVSKSSRVGKDIMCLLNNGSYLPAQIIGRDKDNDLVLLKIDKSSLGSINLYTEHECNVGQLLGAVGMEGEVIKSGILSVQKRKVPSKRRYFNWGFLGVQFDGEDDTVIERIIDGEAAKRAGLKEGDEIIKFDTLSDLSRESIIDYLRTTKPGQKVLIHAKREYDGIKKFEVTLGTVPENSFRRSYHPAYATTVSKRNRGFPIAFRHDIPIEVDECGTPVVNLQGKIIGINIARVDRTGSLAIPIDHVYKVVQTIMNNNNN
ncbi:MAG: trypsin-like peptidase domain-containing protein [Clostridia bacterium]|nr:trypsin-like peptidase domain-containing protein [Clostridia bacterium]